MVEGASGMELATKFGTAASSGAAAGFGAAVGLGSAGQSGTMRTRHSTGGTSRDYADGAISMNFLDSYFSQVIGAVVFLPYHILHYVFQFCSSHRDSFFKCMKRFPKVTVTIRSLAKKNT